MLRAYNGKEPTDPAKLGEICVRLSRHPDPPMELLIGADAVHMPVSTNMVLIITFTDLFALCS